jgi:hypothetical protein
MNLYALRGVISTNAGTAGFELAFVVSSQQYLRELHNFSFLQRCFCSDE